jgi:hypothetical protein
MTIRVGGERCGDASIAPADAAISPRFLLKPRDRDSARMNGWFIPSGLVCSIDRNAHLYVQLSDNSEAYLNGQIFLQVICIHLRRRIDECPYSRLSARE